MEHDIDYQLKEDKIKVLKTILWTVSVTGLILFVYAMLFNF